ncbi:hypothetical protein BO443_110264 [Burkholderia orbicola]
MIDESGPCLAALQEINGQPEAPIKVRKKRHLTNSEQNHRAKRRTRPVMSFKNFRLRMHHFWRSQNHPYDSQRSDE